MTLTINELDQVLGYDPATHSFAGLPTHGPQAQIPAADRRIVPNAPKPYALPSATAPRSQLPAAQAMQAPDVTQDLSSTGLPSMTSPQAPADIAKPKESAWQKIKHGLATAGNIAGDVFAPGVMMNIPGTEMNKNAQAWKRLQAEGEQAKTEQEKAAAENLKQGWQPVVLGTNPVTGEPIIGPAKFAGTLGAASLRGQTAEDVTGQKTEARHEDVATQQQGENQRAANKPPTAEQNRQWQAGAEESLAQGTINDADRQRLAGLERNAKLSGVNPAIVSQVGQPPIAADFPKGKEDPDFKKADAAWGKQVTDLQNAQAAIRGAAFGNARPVQVVDENGNLRYMSAGQAEQLGVAGAAEGTKAMSKQAQFKDITNASQQVRRALEVGGNANFTPDQVAKLTLAMHESDPGVMANEISNLAASGLNPEQQTLVTWLFQLQERALSLRNIAGMGQGSETTRQAILKALPGITSGSKDMAIKQMDAFDNMVANLATGIPKVKGQGGAATGGENTGGRQSVKDWQANRNKPQ